jgi:hypothetical protein
LTEITADPETVPGETFEVDARSANNLPAERHAVSRRVARHFWSLACSESIDGAMRALSMTDGIIVCD